jgi:hypothetical protein
MLVGILLTPQRMCRVPVWKNPHVCSSFPWPSVLFVEISSQLVRIQSQLQHCLCPNVGFTFLRLVQANATSDFLIIFRPVLLYLIGYAAATT